MDLREQYLLKPSPLRFRSGDHHEIIEIFFPVTFVGTCQDTGKKYSLLRRFCSRAGKFTGKCRPVRRVVRDDDMAVFFMHQPVHGSGKEFCRPEDQGEMVMELVSDED